MSHFSGRAIIILRFLFLLFIVVSATTPQDKFAVIVNPQASVSEMKYSELLAVLKGEKTYWKNGSKVSIALLKTSTKAGDDIAKTIYGMSGDDLNKYWLSLVFQGNASPPNFFDTENDLKSFVAKTKGAIGILTSKSLIENDKCVLIDGRKFFGDTK